MIRRTSQPAEDFAPEGYDVAADGEYRRRDQRTIEDEALLEADTRRVVDRMFLDFGSL